ncbi:uncharacterized protein LOC143736155 [Siphateles boraxobius]|uniref:uncharacterized protein LOC143736155 n=1 Tax=Siphateles boraxobius TaxID=180520 RepID=UPI0040630416
MRATQEKTKQNSLHLGYSSSAISAMSVNDQCRLCHENVRIKGNIVHSKLIFNKEANQKSIDERLTELGLTLLQVQVRSCRICSRCVRLIGRLEDALANFRGWQKAEEEPLSEQSSETLVSAKTPVAHKRNREPTPSKLRPQPRTPTAPPATKLSRPTTENRARQSVTEVVIYYASRPKGVRIVCQDDTAGMVEAIAKKNWSVAANHLTRHKELFGPLSENILQIIEDECKNICNPFKDSMLSKSSAADLKAFSFENLQADLQRLSPFVFSIFLRITKQSANIACAAAAIALKGREPRLSAFSYYVNGVLQYAGVKKAAFKRLSKLGIATYYTSAVRKQKELASTCGEDFQLLKVANEIFLKEHEDTSTANGGSVPGRENQGTKGATRTSTLDDSVGDLDEAMHSMKPFVLSDEPRQSTQENTTVTQQAIGVTTTPLQMEQQPGSDNVTAVLAFSTITDTEMADLGVAIVPEEAPTEPTLPCTYSIIFDNLDFFSHTHHQSINRANQSIHWIHHIAVEDRVPSNHLSRHKPTQPLTDYNIGKSLPSLDSQAQMRCDYVVLGSRILTKYLNAFKPLSAIVVHHIPHQYSAEMSEHSTHHPLGLLFKDENQSTELADVLQHLQNEYVPKGPDGPQSILVGGDRLTEGNSRGIQWAFAEGENVDDRLEGLVFKFEDWHAIRNLFEIYHRVFYKEGSARDHGTLLANMNKLRFFSFTDEPQPP